MSVTVKSFKQLGNILVGVDTDGEIRELAVVASLRGRKAKPNEGSEKRRVGRKPKNGSGGLVIQPPTTVDLVE